MESKMKDSGIPWIGVIPEHWNILRNKNVLIELKEVVGEDTSFPLLSLSLTGVKLRDLGAGGKFPAEFNTYKKVNPENLVFCLFDMDETPRTIGLSKFRGMITGAYNVYRVCPEVVTPDWVYYFYLSIDQQKALKPYYSGLRKVVKPETFAKIHIPVPPIAEQERIAAYLDGKCGEIDELIDVEQQMISDLESYRQAVITEAVTHGLNPSENNTDSGVYWIGYVPSKWHIAKMKYFITITNGSDPKTEGDVPVYGSGASSFKTCGEFKEGPTVLIGRKGATLHIPHYIEGRYWNVDTAFDTRVNNFNLRYFYYLASSLDYRAYISATTLPSMTQSNYENMLIPVPPLAEQQEIAEYLDTKCSEIDELIKVKQEKIETLKQYRQSLIFEAVTGKTPIIENL